MADFGSTVNKTVARDPVTGRFTKLTPVEKVGNKVDAVARVNTELLEKFSDVMGSVATQMEIQSGFLENISMLQSDSLESQNSRLSQEAERIRDKKRSDKLAPGEKEGGDNIFKKSTDKVRGLFDNLTGGFGFIAGKLFSTALLAIVALPLGEFLGGAVGRSLENFGVPEDFAKTLGSGFGEAASFGLLAGIIGKRFGLAIFAGVLAKNFISDTMERASSDSFLGSLDSDFWSKMGGVIGTAFSLPLLSPKTSIAIGKFLTVGRGAFIGKIGLGAAIAGIGNALGNFVADQTGDEKLGKVISTAANILAFGAMFTPARLVVGAISSIAFLGASWLVDFYQRQEAMVNDRLAKRVEEIGATKLLDSLGADGNILGDITAGRSGEDTAAIVAQEVAKADDFGIVLDKLKGQINNEILVQSISELATNIADEIEELKKNGVDPEELKQIQKRVTQLQVAKAKTIEILTDDPNVDLAQNKSFIIGEIESALSEATGVSGLNFKAIPLKSPTLELRTDRLERASSSATKAGTNIIVSSPTVASSPTTVQTTNTTIYQLAQPSRVLDNASVPQKGAR
ncbi:MAG: hypothetical protein COA84_13075 [Robiginitomaculum sp.]|nr:MAG: hypothetical protein COA84_13075 [Robiginitomaculum sp.]